MVETYKECAKLNFSSFFLGFQKQPMFLGTVSNPGLLLHFIWAAITKLAHLCLNALVNLAFSRGGTLPPIFPFAIFY